VKARLDAKNDCYVAELPSLALRDVRISGQMVTDNERMLTDGFFAEAHVKLRPVETNTDGVFLAGCAQGPRDIPDTVTHAGAAASMAIALMNKKEVTISPIVANVDEKFCSACKTCLSICPYQAISYNEDFMILFPSDPKIAQAAQGLDGMKKMLAQSKMKIGDFYFYKRDNYTAARVFYNEAITSYPDSDVAKLARVRLNQVEAKAKAAAESGGQQKKHFLFF